VNGICLPTMDSRSINPTVQRIKALEAQSEISEEMCDLDADVDTDVGQSYFTGTRRRSSSKKLSKSTTS
jgi:hypothetical protein